MQKRCNSSALAPTHRYDAGRDRWRLYCLLLAALQTHPALLSAADSVLKSACPVIIDYNNPQMVNIEQCMYSSGERFMSSEEDYFCVYLPSSEATREINTKITLKWVHLTVHHESTYIVLFFTWNNKSINYEKNEKKIFTQLTSVSLFLFTFCWWRHNRLLMTSQWPDNCVRITQTVIYNSLDIDFIHSWLCKNNSFMSNVVLL